MPFTFIHPAVVPIARSPLVPSALVVGAIAPDLPYFVSLMWIGGDYNLTLTHSAASLLWLDPLIALGLVAAFHAVKKPLVAVLPSSAAGRVAPVTDKFVWRSPVALLWILVSVILGASTHLGWDALCDAFGSAWSTRLNLISDVLGGLVLLWWFWHWWRATVPQPIPRDLMLGKRACMIIVSGSVVFVVSWTVARGVRTASQVSADLREYGAWSRSAVMEYVVRAAAIDVVTALGVAVLIYAFAWHVHRFVAPTSIIRMSNESSQDVDAACDG